MEVVHDPAEGADVVKNLQVLPLLCPTCAGRLLGLRYDRVFFCLSCRQALQPSPEQAGWEKYPLRFSLLESPPGPHPIYLPMLNLEISFSIRSQNRAHLAASRQLADLKSVWVMGFNLVKPGFYGDLGLLYTEKNVRLSPADPPPGALLAGCVRTAAEAERYAKLFLSLLLDRRADVTGMDLQVETGNLTFWAVPFADLGEKIVDPLSGHAFPAFAVDDLEDLRRIGGKK